MKKLNYEFRDKLDAMLGGFSHNYCYQCGACVADCPAHRFMPEFSPRTIIIKSLYGLEEELIGPDSLIWNCTNCYNCDERCPQDVHPIEVIITLKNMARQRGTHLANIDKIIERVGERGVTVMQTEMISKRRRELGLDEHRIDCLEELAKLMPPVKAPQKDTDV